MLSESIIEFLYLICTGFNSTIQWWQQFILNKINKGKNETETYANQITAKT
jgi:hypothetical protein